MTLEDGETDEFLIFLILKRSLRANAQKYREKGGHGENLTNLCFEFKERN